MLKGGRTSFGVVFPRKLEALAILKGGGGGAKGCHPGFSNFVAPPPFPIINQHAVSKMFNEHTKSFTRVNPSLW